MVPGVERTEHIGDAFGHLSASFNALLLAKPNLGTSGIWTLGWALSSTAGLPPIITDFKAFLSMYVYERGLPLFDPLR